MMPRHSLEEICPIMIERQENKLPETKYECPNLEKAIEERIEEFRAEQAG
jgi:hypothetical protein